MLTPRQKAMLTRWAREYEKKGPTGDGKTIPFWKAVSVIPYELYEEIEAVRPCETFHQEVNSFIASRDWERVGV